MNINRKLLKAVSPYSHSGFLNFKMAPFEAWKHNGGDIAMTCYPPRSLHGAAFRWELPTICKNNKEARLRFVEPVSLSFDTFPDYARYEVVPMFWDCWPCYFEKRVIGLNGIRLRQLYSLPDRQQSGCVRLCMI